MKLKIVLFRKEEENIEEAQAVRPTRDGDDEVFFLPPETLCGDGVLDTLQKGPHKRSDVGAIFSQYAL